MLTGTFSGRNTKGRMKHPIIAQALELLACEIRARRDAGGNGERTVADMAAAVWDHEIIN